MRRVSRTREGTIVKTCACGRTYTRAEWNKLRLVGEQVDDVERAELRDCVCGSTIALGSVRARVEYTVETIDGGWLLFRRAGSGDAIAIGIGARARVFPSRDAAVGEIASQRRADRSAATRLAVDLIEIGPANDTEVSR